MTIPVYEAESGLAKAIQEDTSVAYVTEASAFEPNQEILNELKDLENPELAKANNDEFDLFWMNSVLASVGWNGNDDVFDPGESWAAKDSPVHKKFNFMHNETDIIGHMTASLILDPDGKVIPKDTVEVPKQFDIVVASVLWKEWDDPELQTRMDDIIDNISKGNWFVSMECLLKNFDYAVISP